MDAMEMAMVNEVRSMGFGSDSAFTRKNAERLKELFGINGWNGKDKALDKLGEWQAKGYIKPFERVRLDAFIRAI